MSRDREQTATLQTALLHAASLGAQGCGPRCEPLDGFGAGPDQDLNNPLGVGGTSLHGWALSTRTFQKKSSSAIRTAQTDIDLIHERLKIAQQHYQDHHES